MPLYFPISSNENPGVGLPAEFISVTSEENSSTTSATYQTKLTFTTDPLIGGTYSLWWYIRNSTSSANKDFQIQVIDESTQIAYYQARYTQASHEIPFSGVFILENVSPNTVKTFTMQFARIDSTTLTVAKARFLFWRVS